MREAIHGTNPCRGAAVHRVLALRRSTKVLSGQVARRRVPSLSGLYPARMKRASGPRDRPRVAGVHRDNRRPGHT